MNCGNEPENEEMIVAVHAIYAIAWRSLKKSPEFFFQASSRNCINCVHCDDHFFIFIKNFYSSNLLCICPSLLETNLNKAKYSSYCTKNCQAFLASQVPVLKRNKATNFSLLLIIHFSAAMKTLVFGNLFTLLRLPITFARAICCWE